MKRTLIFILFLFLFLNSSFSFGYNFLYAETTEQDIKLIFDKKIDTPRHTHLIINVYEQTSPHYCDLKPVYYEALNHIRSEQVSDGWKYILSRRGYGELCFVDVYDGIKMNRYWINAFDGVCSVMDAQYINGTDCDFVLGEINPEFVWWNSVNDTFVVYLNGTYDRDYSIYTNKFMNFFEGPVKSGFLNIGSFIGENHCGEDLLVMITDSESNKVLSSRKLNVGCSSSEIFPVCGDFICSDMEFDVCLEDCENIFNEVYFLKKSYNSIEVVVETVLYEDDCKLLFFGDNYSKEHVFSNNLFERFNQTVIFGMSGAVTGDYYLQIICDNFNSSKNLVNYCSGCVVDELCVENMDLADNFYCLNGVLRPLISNGDWCNFNSSCVSAYCDADNEICMPSNKFNRLFWKIFKKY